VASNTNSFEGGSDTTTITTGNSGGSSGTAFDAVGAPVSGSTLAFSTTHAVHGSLSAKIGTGTTADTPYVSWTSNVAALTVYFRIYLWFDANPGSNTNILRALNSSDQTMASLRVNTTGKLQMLNSANSAAGSASTNAVPLGQWFRIEWKVFSDASAGTLDTRLYNTADSLSITETVSATSVNTRGGNNSRYRYGIINSISSIGPFWFDDIGVSDSDWMGPSVVATPPKFTVVRQAAGRAALT